MRPITGWRTLQYYPGWALVQWATTPQQKVLTGTLGTIQEITAQTSISAPVVIVVGEVVRLRDKLKWFEGDRQI